ncbi:MAG: hypothetical protein J3Q66DRAFT_334122 [Benniella sp.]|nr:MAG: hypothetical protein J3Q66DRAFT_334122 [Benniella sp.]
MQLFRKAVEVTLVLFLFFRCCLFPKTGSASLSGNPAAHRVAMFLEALPSLLLVWRWRRPDGISRGDSPGTG